MYFISLKTDFRGYMACMLYGFYLGYLQFVYTLWCKFKMKLWKVKYESGCSFRGKTLFYRFPNTTIKIGANCRFNSNSRFNFRGINHSCILQTSKGGNIIIGNNCGFSGVSIVSSCGVTIGNCVLCGANVQIGDRNDHEDIYPQFKPLPITIGDGVWIGMNSVVMRGVSIGENTIIGANSIVTKDIPANVVAAGNPCKVIKLLN